MRIRNPGFIYCILISCRWAGDGSDYTPDQPALQGAGQEEAAGGRFPDPRIRSMRIPKPWFLFTVLLFWSLAGEQVMEVTTPLDPDQLVRGTDPASDPDLH